ncbi:MULTISPECIES: hypothetical protein [unclassified Kribbella]|uniref:hypothetical protein n=1 Tax=unclassified Kribbella TaxID=2644121 RepID=UPI00301AB00E
MSEASIVDTPIAANGRPTALDTDGSPETEGKVDQGEPESPTTPTPRPRKRTARKRTAKKAAKKASSGKATRRTRIFPATTFEDALERPLAIYQLGSGQPVRRLTLFNNLGKSPDSGPTRQLVTTSAKYGLTTGSYKAEFLALTDDGLAAVADDASAATRLRARLRLAIESIDVFRKLYETYVHNRLPAQAVLMDKAKEVGVPDEDVAACVETFTVNTKFVGVLRSISGAERLLDIDTVIDDFPPEAKATSARAPEPYSDDRVTQLAESAIQAVDHDHACFYITPIGAADSEARKHSDLFMGSLIEPVLNDFGLNLVRADQIGDAGMITKQIIDHIVHSKLVIVDLSFHNPNVFHELALRHAVRKPIVQLCRAADKLPFDVNQVRTIVVDTTDIYTLVPALDSLRAQIATQIRKTLDERSNVENPLSVFAPDFWTHLPIRTQ